MARKPDMKAGKDKGMPSAVPRARGFVHAGGLLAPRLRSSAEKRGFAETRLLTHWAEVAGADVAAVTQPVSVSYGQGGIGATLVLLAEGARAPELQAQLPRIRERVNACYGYNAISRIRLTQTAANGFGEAAAAFKPREPEPIRDAEIASALAGVNDSGLRAALDQLGRSVLARPEVTVSGKRVQ